MEKIVLPKYGSNLATAGKIVLPKITPFDVHPPTPVPTFSQPLLPGGTNPFPNAGSSPAFAPKDESVDLIPIIGQGAVATVKNPVPALGGVMKGTMDVFFNALKGGASLVGAHDFSKYVADNQEAVNEIFESNMKTKDAHTAGMVGQFVGQQVPYILAGAGVASAATGLVSGIASEAGGLTLSQIHNIGTLTRVASNVAGFTAVNQILLDPAATKDERLKQLAIDLVVLGTLEGLGAGLRTYGDRKLAARAKAFYSELKVKTPGEVNLERVMAEANALKAQIEVRTGDSPQKLLQNHLPRLLEAQEERLLLQGQRTTGAIEGEGFVMFDKSNKAQLAKGKALNEYRIALAKHNANPSEATKDRVLKARAARDKAFEQVADVEDEIEAELKKPKPKAKAGEKPKAPSVPPPELDVPDTSVPAPVVIPKETVRVPGSQLPVGTGPTKVSGLEARIKGKLDALTPEDQAGISTYQQMNKASQIRKAVEYVEKHPEDAIRVLKGEIPPPKGILYNSIFLAMEEQASADAGLALKLASLRSTRAGQEISILTERDPLSPVKYMTELGDAKIEALGGRAKVAELRNAEVKNLKKTIKKSNLSKQDWGAFIDSITC